jgi:hypothetical protein
MPAGERPLRLTVGISGAGANGFAGLNYISEKMLKDFLTMIGIAPLITPAGTGNPSAQQKIGRGQALSFAFQSGILTQLGNCLAGEGAIYILILC